MKNVKPLTAVELLKKLDLTKKATTMVLLPFYLLDVRSAYEAERTGLILGSYLFPCDEVYYGLTTHANKFEQRFAFTLPQKHDEIVFYCDHGKRAQIACAMAHHLGYVKATHYPGGIREWSQLHPDRMLKFPER